MQGDFRTDEDDKKPPGHNLRPRRAHGFALPIKDSRNFVARTLCGALRTVDISIPFKPV